MPWHWEYLSKKQMDWEPFKCLSWNANESTVKLMVSVTSGGSLWYRPYYKNILIYDNDKKCRKLRAIWK